MVDLINRYRDCFAMELSEVGCHPTTELKIKTKENEPVNLRRYLFPPSQNEKTECMIKEMEGSGIIESSSSPYNSPLVIVKKRNSEERICIDFRRLNEITIKEHFPCVRTEETLERTRVESVQHAQFHFRLLSNPTEC